MKNFLKRKWIIGIVILALILAIGITIPALAASGNNNSNSNGYGYFDGPTLTRLAEALGLTPADLSSQLQSGKTLANLAQEHNVPLAALEDVIIAPYKDRLSTQVKYGYLTQEQANSLLANAKDRAATLLEQDLSSKNYNGNFGSCYNYMSANGYGTGPGWGGLMGPGMMNGWGSNSGNSRSLTPDTDSNNAFGCGRNSQNGGPGVRGMMRKSDRSHVVL